MNGDHSLNAIFTQIQQIQYTMKVSNAGTGAGSVSLSPSGGSYAIDTTIILTAIPTTGSTFTGWSGDLTGTANPATLTMNGDKTVTATFTQSNSPSTRVFNAASTNDIQGWDGQSTANVRASINRFVQLTGKPLYCYNTWLADWGNYNGGPGPFNWLLQSGDHSILPLLQDGTIKAVMVVWMPYKNVNDQQSLKDIANGAYNSYITTQAQLCKSFGYPIYMRFGPEMNINQGYPEANSWAANPTDFVNAWRHVVDIFRAQGASNVIWVWNPNFNESPGAPHHYTEYYPGDGYVDWVGIDMYQCSDNVDPATEMSYLYNDYGSRKPVAICEWASNSYEWMGTTTKDALRASYTQKFFDAVEARVNVKMITYFHSIYFCFDPYSTPLTLATYQQRISKSIYVIS
jgi:uncharacterized repeat protein (TIGR02543 family)